MLPLIQTTDVEALVGREPELTRIDLTIAGGRDGASTLLLIGDPGLGKSALVRAAAERAGQAGLRVLQASGVESESELAFAGLHLLLRPVLDSLPRIPARQADALRSAFGMADGPSPDRFLVGIATLGVLADAAEQGPLLLAIDDAHSMDRGSLEAVAFAVRRLQAEPVATLVASRDPGTAAMFGAADLLVLGPLDDQASQVLVGREAPALRGSMRRRVLAEAAGNPLALVELSVAATQRAEPEPALAVAIPPSDRMERLFEHRLRDVPAPTRRLLLVAAANDDDDARPVLSAGALLGLSAADLRPAEDQGLLALKGDQIVWRHPLARSVVYHVARGDERRDAHAALARAFEHAPERHAWHLAATADGPDEGAAQALESTAHAMSRRTGFDAAARALMRAAQLSPGAADHARRLVMAAEMALAAGRVDLVRDLIPQIEAATGDPALRARASMARAHLRTIIGSSAGVRPTTGEEIGRVLAADPRLGFAMLGLAAGQSFLMADGALREAVQGVARSVPGPGGEAWRLYCLAASDASLPASDFLPHLDGLLAQGGDDPAIARIIALTYWHLDLHDPAVGLLTEIVDGMRGREPGDLPAFLVTLALSSIDNGRLADARALAVETAQLAADVGQPLMTGASHAIHALVAARTGDLSEVADHAEAAARHSRDAVVLAIAAWARGLEALGGGRHEEAARHLGGIVRPGGPASHPEIARWAIGDLAEAIKGSPAVEDVRAIAEVHARAEVGVSSRVRHVARRAMALVSPEAGAEARFGDAFAVEVVDQWPFEHARTQLASGEWLRRQRRVREARVQLGAAAAAFENLGCSAWAERAAGELRSAGVAVDRSMGPASDELTPQQLQIAQLAARGLSNSEIATRLYLSPRTVGFHLYNVFPKLGVTTRAQLAGALARPSADPRA
jgi:DNA-binding CsgD family transcriptional regulator